MHELEADIRWHEEQIRLAKAALRDADQLENPTRQLEVSLLASSIQKLERTMGHLEELRIKRV
jgi:hypothetical protein